ncbi:DUF2752 domain-containing protein [Mucilaginibacter sp.]|uniref:DUF2752 domain-containing protein n=1 Tax=Mucilaginibacter sp. TaxID=1882438 RepID=UPI0038CD5BA1
MLPCAYKAIFGIDCPGCGFQRSFIALLKGHLSESFFLYPATIPILVSGIFLIFESKFHLSNSKLVRKTLYISILTIIFVSYSVKMFRIYLHHTSV